MYGTLTTKEQNQNKTKTNNPNKNWAKNLNRPFLQRRNTWKQVYKQIKITMNYHLKPVKMAIIKKKKDKYWQYEEKLEPLHTVGGNAKWCSCCGGHYGGSSKLKIELQCDPAITLEI